MAGSILAFPGSIVRANDTPLVVINQVDPIHVQFSAPESRLAEIRQASTAADGLAVRASIPGNEPLQLTGKLSFIDNAVDSSTGTIVLKAEFANPMRQLTPGQFVEVELLLRQLRDALVIPSEALQNGPNGSFVYVARNDGTVELRPVRIGPGGEGATLVVSEGLVAGERIVVDGQLRLTPGARYSDSAAGARRLAPANANANGEGQGNGNAHGDGIGHGNGNGNGAPADGRRLVDPS